MTRFRQALLDELLARVDEQPMPVPARRVVLRRPRLALAGAGLVAATAAVAIALTQATATPAYAVTENSDGTVSISGNRLGDPTDANRFLQAHNIPAKVMLPSAAADCPVADRGSEIKFEGRDMFGAGGTGEDTVIFIPGVVPSGRMFVIVPVKGTNGEILFGTALFQEPGPKCIVVDPSAASTSAEPTNSPS